MIERGDEVFHRPSGENWVVKRTGTDNEGGFVEPAGWPPCRARADDCDLVAKGKHTDFLRKHAKEAS